VRGVSSEFIIYLVQSFTERVSLLMLWLLVQELSLLVALVRILESFVEVCKLFYHTTTRCLYGCASVCIARSAGDGIVCHEVLDASEG